MLHPTSNPSYIETTFRNQLIGLDLVYEQKFLIGTGNFRSGLIYIEFLKNFAETPIHPPLVDIRDLSIGFRAWISDLKLNRLEKQDQDHQMISHPPQPVKRERRTVPAK